ncbi:alkaline phosphatase PafA [Zeaxanthinibacter enoshimensis]|uniref:Type I phosphodiesterase/nucleotide pyrophosphatase n=1 Tax=Zeaxanthinibacter enoshimensis TaxID=392009 RepID=A0A4R6TFD7_9FLAO|nr:alkaline phosphatase PafA [Zeaxanthinibacter enoshimensis]TDQ28957.1 type I phosphodiesterase/nucleotide pyrophosphatase [Zeaxanthinibacter enoshimensis]
MVFPKRQVLGLVMITVFCINNIWAQKKDNRDATPFKSPKLVVGIVVDQMRYDYLTRFWSHYGDGGFKRMVGDGFLCKDHHFNYAPTSTGPGHASVYTGATPSMHGIIGNNWYDKENDISVYCVDDPSYNSVGTQGSAGQASPHRLLVSTITDQLRLHTQMRGKVVAVALKDRGAVLPGGHMANAAYWFVGGDEGKWVSSSYYMNALPAWVQHYNESKAVDQYKKPWNTIKKITSYRESTVDDNAYEGLFEGMERPVFPYDLPALWEANGGYDILRFTPYGNSMTTDFALEALKGEELGRDDITDFLAISYSSTDYAGHKFGVDSKEVQDTYVRLDIELEKLFEKLDKEVGEGEYTVFLTADHGAIPVPSYLSSNKMPAGYTGSLMGKQQFQDFLQYKYGGTELIKNISNDQVFLDQEVVKSLDLNPREIQEELARELLGYEDISQVYTAYQMQHNNFTSGIPYILQNGYNQKRSGDILYVPKAGYISYGKTGSTHGSAQIYDTHVPLLFYGAGIRQGSTTERTEIPDIAPTISVLLGIAYPNGTTGEPIGEVLE